MLKKAPIRFSTVNIGLGHLDSAFLKIDKPQIRETDEWSNDIA